MLDTMYSKINVPFIFSRRPESIPPDLRPIWRIALLLLLLHSCRGYRASLKKLHVLNWAIRMPESRQRFIRYINGEGKPDDVIIRFEPGLNRAINFAKGEGLITIKKGKSVELTTRGIEISNIIYQTNNFFIEERKFLQEITPFVLEKNIDALLNWETKL